MVEKVASARPGVTSPEGLAGHGKQQIVQGPRADPGSRSCLDQHPGRGRRLDFPRAAFYSFVKNKEQLLNEVLQQAMDVALRSMSSIASQEVRPAHSWPLSGCHVTVTWLRLLQDVYGAPPMNRAQDLGRTQ